MIKPLQVYLSEPQRKKLETLKKILKQKTLSKTMNILIDLTLTKQEYKHPIKQTKVKRDSIYTFLRKEKVGGVVITPRVDED